MMKRALIGAALVACATSPALALEHAMVIEHADGPIAADYRGEVTITTKQIGTAGVAGRPSTLRCQWTASLNVDRVAKLGDTMRSHRALTMENVTDGSQAGWCPTNPQALDKLVDARDARFKAALLALVEQDRAALLADAESAKATIRG